MLKWLVHEPAVAKGGGRRQGAGRSGRPMRQARPDETPWTGMPGGAQAHRNSLNEVTLNMKNFDRNQNSPTKQTARETKRKAREKLCRLPYHCRPSPRQQPPSRNVSAPAWTLNSSRADCRRATVHTAMPHQAMNSVHSSSADSLAHHQVPGCLRTRHIQQQEACQPSMHRGISTEAQLPQRELSHDTATSAMLDLIRGAISASEGTPGKDASAALHAPICGPSIGATF